MKKAMKQGFAAKLWTIAHFILRAAKLLLDAVAGMTQSAQNSSHSPEANEMKPPFNLRRLQLYLKDPPAMNRFVLVVALAGACSSPAHGWPIRPCRIVP